MKVLVGKKHPLSRPAAHHAPREASARLETESHAEADLLRKALELRADAIVVDADLAGATELAAWSHVPMEADRRTLVLCMHPGASANGTQGILATACAFFLDTVSLDAIEQVVAEVHGRSCFGAVVPRAPALAISAASLLGELSAREQQILALLAQEKTSKEIALQLGLSPRTVDSHRSNLIKKLGVQGTVGLACYAVGAGLVRS